MTLIEELTWRGFANQTTYKDVTVLDGEPITFYLGVDPSADSMTIGNLAAIMMVRKFIAHGHNAVLLIGGATGLIGDPDGKSEERTLKTMDEIDANKAAIVGQYQRLLDGQNFQVVDNYDWFKSIGYIEFLRDVGKHVPMRQMLGRDFVQSRLGESGAGISYAEFSYVLLQAYDFLYLHQNNGVSLQLCGSDQWGNSIAGVDLIRRVTGDESHVWSIPLVIDKSTGKKFGKTEDGAIWLDPTKTSPTQFYQFWINRDDQGIEEFLKIYTDYTRDEIDAMLQKHAEAPEKRYAQKQLATAVTELVHGSDGAQIAEQATEVLINPADALNLVDDRALKALRQEIPATHVPVGGSIVQCLVATGLAASNTEARRLVQANAIAINGVKIAHDSFEPQDFIAGRLLLRKGKAHKDSALVELGE